MRLCLKLSLIVHLCFSSFVAILPSFLDEFHIIVILISSIVIFCHRYLCKIPVDQIISDFILSSGTVLCTATVSAGRLRHNIAPYHRAIVLNCIYLTVTFPNCIVVCMVYRLTSCLCLWKVQSSNPFQAIRFVDISLNFFDGRF